PLRPDGPEFLARMSPGMSDDTKKGSQGAAASGVDPLIGSVLGGRYRIDTLLGRGSMGRVYAAEHVLMHKPLAVKILNAEHLQSPELVARFEREATAAANIDHPNVVTATDFGKLEDGTVYLALELVQGSNLRAEVARGPLGVRRALHIARQVAAALAAAHARSIVHRDLKPENIVLVEKNGDPDFVKVLDFGIARLMDGSGKSPLTKVGVVLGTLDYMAPEQALGQDVDGRADIYALGVVMYEMLSGHCPYEGESSSAILGLQLTKRPPSFRQIAPTLAIPGAVEGLALKLLAKERKDRPQSAGLVVAELDKLIATLSGSPASANSSATAARAAPAAPVVNKPTFISTDPLPAFTFPPIQEESKQLVAEVQRALEAKGPAPSKGPPPPPSRTGPPPPPVRTPAPPSMSSAAPASGNAATAPPKPEERSAGGAEHLRALREQAARAVVLALDWIDDHRRVLPRVIKRPLRRVPAGAILIAFAALFVFALLLFVWLVGGSASAPARTSRVEAPSAAPPPASAPRVEPATASNAGAAAAIERAEKERAAGNWAGVVAALDAALAADPGSNRDERVQSMLDEAARRGASATAAFKLLVGPMGSHGADIVYGLAVHARTPSDVREKAEGWLASEQFRRVASPELAIAGRLRTTRGCSDKRALLDAAATTGDRRALEYLNVLAVKGGCGRRGREDCFPCLREDDKLSDSIAKLEQRLGGG
ncbi:MAG TPA: serine/threonine-protein kinase, partial [Polyangiaceae bacterium]|nr:serine/threonine-protein kinase [Polyangiaceae bacterium]